MNNDPYGGRKPGCFDLSITTLMAVLALLVLMFGILG